MPQGIVEADLAHGTNNKTVATFGFHGSGQEGVQLGVALKPMVVDLANLLAA